MEVFGASSVYSETPWYVIIGLTYLCLLDWKQSFTVKEKCSIGFSHAFTVELKYGYQIIQIDLNTVG